MKSYFRPIFILFFAIIFQGSGYVGDLPKINDYFQEDRQSFSDTFIDMKKSPSEISRPPLMDTNTLKKELAPANYTNAQIKILRPVKKPVYYNDLLELKPTVVKLKQGVKSDEVQNFGACINVQKFYIESFLAKYKNSPEAQQDIYKLLKDINSYSQALANQWKNAENNLKFVSYSSYNGAYQPSVIKEKLIVLDKKLTLLLKLMEPAE